MPNSAVLLQEIEPIVSPCVESSWNHSDFGDQSEIEILNAGTKRWETIATVNSIEGVDAADIAAFIVEIITDWQQSNFRNRKACLIR